MRDFWQHSILTALLSSRIARETHPESVERAYLAGLLHDVGKLPLLVAAHEQREVAEDLLVAPHDEPERERAYFGLDHKEVGRWMALSGNLPGWMIDVLTHHHDHASATEDPTLVAIVATADRCSHLPATDGSALGDVAMGGCSFSTVWNELSSRRENPAQRPWITRQIRFSLLPSLCASHENPP